MSVKIYHLHFAQSDRIIWLCEELSALIPTFEYELHVFARGDEASEGKRVLSELHPSATAPTMVDTTVSPPITMTESQAMLEYIINVHGQGHFGVSPAAGPHAYSQYLYWLSFANGSFQAFLSANLIAGSLVQQSAADPSGNFVYHHFQARTKNHLKQYDDRLAESKYLAGNDFTAADIMNIYGLTMYRGIDPMDLTEYPHILRYLADITSRPGYGRTMEKGEDGLPPMIQAKVPQLPFEVLLSVASWKTVFGKSS